jgi:hypothetical protein
MLRDERRVVENIERLTARGIDLIGPTHDLSLFGESYWRGLFARVRASRIRISVFHSCFQLPSCDFVAAFQETFTAWGSFLGVPVICGDDRIRKLNGKLFSNQELMEFLACFEGTDVAVGLHFIDNGVECGDRTFRSTDALIRRILDRFAGRIRLGMNYAIELLQPYSAIQRGQHEGKGLRPLWTTFHDWYFRFSPRFLEHIVETGNPEEIVGHALPEAGGAERLAYFSDLLAAKNLREVYV